MADLAGTPDSGPGNAVRQERQERRKPPGALASAGQAALSLEAVGHSYGRLRAVEDLTLGVLPGELVCLLGPSGCGKTTALRLAAGLERLQEGQVKVAGRLVADASHDTPPETRGVGLLFQDYALFPHLSVAANVGFGLRRMPVAERERRVAATLRQVGMSDYAPAFPHTLSGGQQQRVALARALAPQPPVLLLDEPFSGLDERLRKQVRDETLHLLKNSGAATLMVTHDPEEAMFMADRIAVMRAGRLIQLGPPAELYYHPVDAFVASFFGETNRLTGVVRDGRVDTPMGTLLARELADGTEVEVLIRSEAVLLRMVDAVPAGEPLVARVIAARLLGRSSLVHLSLPTGEGRELHLHARAPGRFLPPEGTGVAIRLDRQQSFIFPNKG
ncbi:MAG: ABC transporter ATP-binding protein [Kiloniellales bacterium]